jgi:hypothetical protein
VKNTPAPPETIAYEDKATFQDGKEAHKYLVACPPDVIQHFINQTWCFMDAYWKGLTGKALI